MPRRRGWRQRRAPLQEDLQGRRERATAAAEPSSLTEIRLRKGQAPRLLLQVAEPLELVNPPEDDVPLLLAKLRRLYGRDVRHVWETFQLARWIRATSLGRARAAALSPSRAASSSAGGRSSSGGSASSLAPRAAA